LQGCFSQLQACFIALQGCFSPLQACSTTLQACFTALQACSITLQACFTTLQACFTIFYGCFAAFQGCFTWRFYSIPVYLPEIGVKFGSIIFFLNSLHEDYPVNPGSHKILLKKIIVRNNVFFRKVKNNLIMNKNNF
jgi:hypothetical protein